MSYTMFMILKSHNYATQEDNSIDAQNPNHTVP